MTYIGFSTYLRDKVLKHTHAEAIFTIPAANYLALFTSDPNAGGSEVSGGSYVRKVVSWTGVAAGTNEHTDTNNTGISFTTATADWGTITHAATFDAVSAGNMLEIFQLTNTKEILSGDVFKVNSTELDSALRMKSN